MSLLEKGIKAEDIRKFKKICFDFEKLIKKISEYNDDAMIYCNNGGFSLMRGPTHNEYAKSIKEENEVVFVSVSGRLDCGDW